VTGAEFAKMSDEQLTVELDDIGVIARVAPEDKVRLVQLLQRKGNVVAMTGDGVNDAPALKTADIGVAMGITGTEVSKEAAVMILTDDNFATIVGAVSYGRTLYDNLLKYLRFQMSTLVAYIAIFIGAGIFGIANGAPLNPLQILWLNMVVDIPIAIALGFDAPTKGLMQRPPRPVGAPQGEPAVRSSLRSANAAAPVSNSPAPPSTAVEGKLNASNAQPASPHIASQRGHFRSRAVSVSAQAFAIA